MGRRQLASKHKAGALLTGDFGRKWNNSKPEQQSTRPCRIVGGWSLVGLGPQLLVGVCVFVSF
jgi:hypothetical protein